MQWIVPLAALAVLLLLVRKTKPGPARLRLDTPLEDALPSHLSAVAQQEDGGRLSRISVRRDLLHEMENAIAFLNTLPDDELLPAARWLCDNGRFLQETAAGVLQGRKGMPRLPRASTREPRVCLFAREWLCHSTATVTPQSLQAAIEAWQSGQPLSVQELNALPFALRLTLLELLCQLSQTCAINQRASQAALRAHTLNRHDRPKQAMKLCRKYADCASFLERLLGLEEENEWLLKELEAQGRTAEEVMSQEQRRQAEICLWVGNAITALRTLNRLAWDRFSERVSPVHAVLQKDPVYQRMDLESRAAYRARVSEIALRARLSERTVTSGLSALCQSAEPDSLESHCGYYLLDDGYRTLLAHLRSARLSVRFERWSGEHALALFRLFSWLSFFALVAAAWLLGLSPWSWLPFGAVMVYGLQQFALSCVRRRLTPRITPRIELKRLTEETRTLVVCPTMLTSAQHALAMVKHLLVMHEANPDENLHFLLLGDFQDSLTGTLANDADIMQTASAAVTALCEHTGHAFFYLQRQRVFSPGENTHHSRERKRGGVETVLQLIAGRPIHDSFAAATIDPAWFGGKYRYVITIDSDTLLPPGSALRMVGAMLHPLARRQKRHHRMRGFSVLQPRMETAAHTVGSTLSALLGGTGGTDAYNLLSSDIDQDWFRRGTFMGKGIIDPVPFLDASERRIPTGLVLSHDLLEGELSGCAYASDIVLYDSQPQTLKGFLYRMHRWTRGDWQLLPYVLSFFPSPAHPPRGTLDATGRFKIWRNLFRSLIPPFRLLLLFYGAVSGRVWLWLAALLLPELPWRFDRVPGFLCRTAVLPCEAALQVDAIARTLYRLVYSHRHLLAWTTSAQASRPADKPPMLFFTLSMSAAALFAVSILWPPSLWPCCLLPAIVWAGFAFTLPFLEQERHASPRPTEYMREVLGRLAQHTLTFFETAITPEDHALPPDNVQIDPNKGIAHRTSPTNIGLYLCALVAAEKLRLLTTEELFHRLDDTLTTLERLPKWHGLPYNWYSTTTLEPLAPLFVSSVDCGNLAVSLLTCAQGVRMLLSDSFAEYAALAQRMDALVDAMRLDLLYDPDAELFWIGVNPEKDAATASHYDLLASEARLLSFVAIMLRQVPLKHWYRLGRQREKTRALISYSGTMFEYLMPLLFQPVVEGTLLEASSRAVLRAQRKHRLGGAFGVSESGYYAFDPELNYQYQAFGLPQLALNPSISDEVLAPYASMLSLPLDIKHGFGNFQRMQVLGLEGPLGLFEAADFCAERTDGQTMRIVRSHMAHHQGMILCAICNALENHYIAGLFSNLPRAQAYRLLLEERAARPTSPIRHPLKHAVRKSQTETQVMSREADRLRFPIDAHLLCGGGTSWLIDAQGGGRLSHDGLAITRFHESCDRPSGMRLYLRDSQSGAYWVATDPYLMQSVRFETAQVVFSHVRFDIQTELRLWVNPLDGSAIQLMTLENKTGMERLMELCSYLEPALVPQREDGVHPAFQNLFLQTRRMGKRGIAAVCRPRDPEHPERTLWHMLVSETEISLMRMQSDRLAFLGRGRTFHAPRALEYPIGAVADSLGDVIEPCLSLRGQFVLPAHGKATFAFVTHLAQERETENAFCERYATMLQLLRTYDGALTRGVVTARFLHLTLAMQAELTRLTGALAYAGQPTLSSNGQSDSLPSREIWRFGISGDLPILLMECVGSLNQPLLTLLQKAHVWHRLNGLSFDWVITLEDTSKAQILRTQFEEALGREREGIFVLSAPSAEETALLRRSARLVLKASVSLAEQLDALAYGVFARPLYTCRPSTQWKAELPPVEETLFYNGYGGFTHAEGNYQIFLPPGVQTPAPWCNPLCSQGFGTLASESGLVFTYARNSQSGRLTRWPNDVVSTCGDEAFFLRDAQHHLLWSLCRQPLGHGMPVRVTYAPGEALYESSAYGLYARLHCFTDTETDMGLRMIQLKNDSPQERSITLFHSCSFCQAVSLQAEAQFLWSDAPELGGTIGLCAIDASPSEAASMSPGSFQGLWSSAPFSLSGLERLPSPGGCTGVLAFSLHLLPGETVSLTTAIGFADTRDALEKAMLLLRQAGASQRLYALRAFWEERLGRLQFDLPDAALTLLMNRWLPYQVQASRLWMRAGFYQAGGAIGFRDQLQDMLSLLSAHPREVRGHLLLCAAHQFEEGDVQHWWHPPRYGVRTRISDDKLFLPFVTAAYVEATDDRSVLEESVPYLTGAPLGDSEKERLFEPEVSQKSETLLQHGLRAIDSVRFGAHELPLMGGGDWNDGMNRVGGENGESVWLGMFLCEVLRRFAPLCPEETAERLSQRRIGLLRALDRYAWDGAWYLRGWYHDGSKLGASANTECRIDLLPQAWGVLCGVSRDRCAIAMENAWRTLYEPDTGMLKLFSPPFDGEENPGYVAGYLPGIRENGGQYTHAACWAVSALHQLGQDGRAWELALRLLPTTHAATRQLAARYRVEPYVMAADIYANPQQRGRGGWTWYTGSASWYWTVVLQQLLGFRKKGNQLRFSPVCPAAWENLRITYRLGNATYHLHASRDCLIPESDGEALPGGVLTLVDDGRIHEARFPLR